MDVESLDHGGKATKVEKTKMALAYEIIMAVLALISVLTIWTTNQFLTNVDFVIWIVFVIDVSFRLITSKDKIGYIKSHPLDIVAIIPLDNIFRLARLARLFRLIRALAILNHYFKPFYAILRTNNLDKVLILLFVIIFVSSIPITFLEPGIGSYNDAVWWAIVTTTTVGYGDISPETIIGRAIAVVLMMFGIGLLGLVTSSIASYFMTNSNETSNPTVDYIKGELDRIEELTDQEIERLQVLLETYKGDGMETN